MTSSGRYGGGGGGGGGGDDDDGERRRQFRYAGTHAEVARSACGLLWTKWRGIYSVCPRAITAG